MPNSSFKLQSLSWSDWSRLQSLTLQSWWLEWEAEPVALDLLKTFPRGPSLKAVTLEWKMTHLSQLIRCLRRDDIQPIEHQLCTRLDHALARFPEPRIVCTFDEGGLRDTCSSEFWSRELGKHFPAVSQRGKQTRLKGNEGEF